MKAVASFVSTGLSDDKLVRSSRPTAHAPENYAVSGLRGTPKPKGTFFLVTFNEALSLSRLDIASTGTS